MPRDNITEFPLKTERKTIIINGKKYDTFYIELKSMLPDVDSDYIGYYDFDLEEHGALCGFLFVEKVMDYTIGAGYHALYRHTIFLGQYPSSARVELYLQNLIDKSKKIA